MIKGFQLENYGPLQCISCEALGKINLIIGKNGSGKTFLLQSLYSGIRTIEEFKRGDDKRSLSDILIEKLYWTYQVDKIGDIVSKGTDSPLTFEIGEEHGSFEYQFSKGTTRKFNMIHNDIPPRASNSIFLPSKEVLSIHHIILKSREQDHTFGFDDTYYDLARAVRLLPLKGHTFKEFTEAKSKLEALIDGKVEFNESTQRWVFTRGNHKFPIGITAEGIKKIAILDRLLGNSFLDDNSVIFIDEPESNLHPEAISKLLDIIVILAKCGIQFFLASHSYFVIKKLFLLAIEHNINIPLMLEQNVDDIQKWTEYDLRDGMPDNPIIDESIQLYEQEVELAIHG